MKKKENGQIKKKNEKKEKKLDGVEIYDTRLKEKKYNRPENALGAGWK